MVRGSAKSSPRREVPFSFVSCGWEKRKVGDVVCLCGRKKGWPHPDKANQADPFAPDTRGLSVGKARTVRCSFCQIFTFCPDTCGRSVPALADYPWYADGPPGLARQSATTRKQPEQNLWNFLFNFNL
jgi:hypothetical protein